MDYDKYLNEAFEIRIPAEAVQDIQEHWSDSWCPLITDDSDIMQNKIRQDMRLDSVTITIIPSRVEKYMTIVKKERE